MKRLSLLSGLTVVLSVCACCDPGTLKVRAGDSKGKQDTLGTLLKKLTSKNEDVRLNAAIQLQEFGPKAAAAAPNLAKLFADKNEDVVASTRPSPWARSVRPLYPS